MKIEWEADESASLHYCYVVKTTHSLTRFNYIIRYMFILLQPSAHHISLQCISRSCFIVVVVVCFN